MNSHIVMITLWLVNHFLWTFTVICHRSLEVVFICLLSLLYLLSLSYILHFKILWYSFGNFHYLVQFIICLLSISFITLSLVFPLFTLSSSFFDIFGIFIISVVSHIHNNFYFITIHLPFIFVWLGEYCWNMKSSYYR